MIGTLIALCVIQGGEAKQAPSAASLISTMMAKYASAKTLSGTITLTQGTENESGQIATSIQYERPNKLYILQQQKTSTAKSWLVTCDGKHFSFNAPNMEYQNAKRLVEPVTRKVLGEENARSTNPKLITKEVVLTLGEIYSAASAGLSNRSEAIDVLIGRREHLDYLRRQWATLNYVGAEEQSGEKLHIMNGNWREYGDAPVSGKFKLVLTDDGDLRQYNVYESMLLGQQTITVITRYDVKVTVNGPVRAELFKVIL